MPYKEGIYVGYRYYDSFQVEPRYAFGYGLGYTSFRAQVRSVVLEGLTVRFDVSVSNTGTMPEPGSLPVLNFSGEEIRTQHFSYEESCVQIFSGQNGDLTAQ